MLNYFIRSSRENILTCQPTKVIHVFRKDKQDLLQEHVASLYSFLGQAEFKMDNLSYVSSTTTADAQNKWQELWTKTNFEEHWREEKEECGWFMKSPYCTRSGVWRNLSLPGITN